MNIFTNISIFLSPIHRHAPCLFILIIPVHAHQPPHNYMHIPARSRSPPTPENYTKTMPEDVPKDGLGQHKTTQIR